MSSKLQDILCVYFNKHKFTAWSKYIIHDKAKNIFIKYRKCTLCGEQQYKRVNADGSKFERNY